jgi:hypothetical protein
MKLEKFVRVPYNSRYSVTNRCKISDFTNLARKEIVVKKLVEVICPADAGLNVI